MSLRLSENHHYIIYASAKSNKKDMHATPIEIFVDSSLQPLRFVLDKEGWGGPEKNALQRKSPN